jgi:hypothetical protein
MLLEIANKDFASLDTLLTENGWYLNKNEINWISYTKNSHETDVFDIKIEQNNIRVSVPLLNSPFNYVTSFNDSFAANEYIRNHFIHL